MKIEFAYVISFISLVFGIWQGSLNIKSRQKDDVKQDVSEQTTIIVKLEQIGLGITKIENKMNSIENDRKEDREKIIRMDESLKSAWKRIEVMESTNKKALEKAE